MKDRKFDLSSQSRDCHVEAVFDDELLLLREGRHDLQNLQIGLTCILR